jgi:hypothetical protein
MSVFDECKAESDLNYIKSFVDAWPDHPNMLSREDWEKTWRPIIQDICEKTQNVSFKSTGEKIIAKLNQYFPPSS